MPAGAVVIGKNIQQVFSQLGHHLWRRGPGKSHGDPEPGFEALAGEAFCYLFRIPVCQPLQQRRKIALHSPDTIPGIAIPLLDRVFLALQPVESGEDLVHFPRPAVPGYLKRKASIEPFLEIPPLIGTVK